MIWNDFLVTRNDSLPAANDLIASSNVLRMAELSRNGYSPAAVNDPIRVGNNPRMTENYKSRWKWQLPSDGSWHRGNWIPLHSDGNGLPIAGNDSRNDPMATGTDLTAALACVTAVVDDSGSYRTRSQWLKTNTSNKFLNFPFKNKNKKVDSVMILERIPWEFKQNLSKKWSSFKMDYKNAPKI